MRKSALSLVLLMVLLNGAYADLVERTWNSGYLYVTTPMGSHSGFPDPATVGWQIDIALAGSYPFDLAGNYILDSAVDANAGTASMAGWYDGYGYYVGGFQFDAVEGDTVVMRIFNGTPGVDATSWIDSLPLVLPDIEGIPAPGDYDVSFAFIPEPSSIAMIGLVSGCAVFVRRRFIL